MIDFIDGAYIAAQIVMLRQVEKCAFLIVEGDTDERALRKFCDIRKCKLEVAFGKKNLLDALDRLEDEGFPGVAAIADADFDRLCSVEHKLENLILTDDHDLDLTIFFSDAFVNVVDEFASPNKFQARSKEDYVRLREKLLSASAPLAACRLASHQMQLDLYFKDIDFSTFIDERDLSVDQTALVKCLISRSNTRVDAGTLEKHMSSLMHLDRRQLICGHDAAAVLGIALRSLLGERRRAQTWASEIEAALRLAFHAEPFKSTHVYRSLREWEESNKNYKILA